MSKKPTLAIKELLNKAVTGETKRCLAVIKEIYGGSESELYTQVVTKIVNESPYIEFHPELLKRIPKI